MANPERRRTLLTALIIAILLLGILLFHSLRLIATRHPSPEPRDAKLAGLREENFPKVESDLPRDKPKVVLVSQKSDAGNPTVPPEGTPFQRRLLAGDKINQIIEESRVPSSDARDLWNRLKAIELELLHEEEDLIRFLRFLFKAKQPVTLAGDAKEKIAEAVGQSLGACSLKNLKLAQPSPSGDPLGRDLHIRLWTLDGRFSKEDFLRAESTLDHIERTVGVRIRQGYDALATPKKGDEVLLCQRGIYTWAVGYYYLIDRYCTLETDIASWLRPEVLKHELIHAFCYGHREGFLSSTFISEGLAEYLRFCEPGDQGFFLPPGRMKHEFARLLAILKNLSAKGLDPASMEPSRLLDLSPGKFYALRHISYLMALSAMAFIGGHPIEKAFREGSDRPIGDAVRTIPWTDLLAFIEKHGQEGSPDRAIVVTDPAGEPQDVSREDARTGKDLLDTLEALGIVPDPDVGFTPEDFSFFPEERILDRSLIASLLRLLLSERESLLVLADRSEQTAGQFRLAEGSEVLAAPFTAKALRADDRRGFVQSLLGILQGRPPETTIPLFGIDKEPAEVDPRSPATKAYTALGLPLWLNDKKSAFHLLLFVAGKDGEAREILDSGGGPPPDEEEIRLRLARLYQVSFDPIKASIRSALVVDLSRGAGDALPLALGLASLKDFHGSFAYWDPQADE